MTGAVRLTTTRNCLRCESTFSPWSHRPGLYCTRGCASASTRTGVRSRWCPRGHDKDRTGREGENKCSECRRWRENVRDLGQAIERDMALARQIAEENG